MYYAEVMVYPDGKVCLSYQMSRYLPWGEHVVDESSAWKEHIYPSEPKEITFEEWLEGFLKQKEKANESEFSSVKLEDNICQKKK